MQAISPHARTEKLLEKTNDILDQIAQLMVEQQVGAAKRHSELMARLDSMEGFLSLITNNTDS